MTCVESLENPGYLIVWTLLHQWQETLKSTRAWCDILGKGVMSELGTCSMFTIDWCYDHWPHLAASFSSAFCFLLSQSKHTYRGLHLSHVPFHWALCSVLHLTYTWDVLRSAHIHIVLGMYHHFCCQLFLGLETTFAAVLAATSSHACVYLEACLSSLLWSEC